MDNGTKIYTDEELQEIIRQRFPEKTLVDIVDYENEENQTYKFLYDSLKAKVGTSEEELYNDHHDMESLEREIDELRHKIQITEDINDKLKGQTEDITGFICEFMEKEIIISNVKPFGKDGNEIACASDNRRVISTEQLSLNPGVYEFKRPSWFTSLPVELSRENISKKTAANTVGVLMDKVKFWKKLTKKIDDGDLPIEKAMEEVDGRRRKMVAELLQSGISNEEKYIKYLLLTPGMPRDYLKTFIGASELQLNADVVIELLEQPRESFNKEMIEAYVSEVRKGTGYNLKKELANELIRGDWYIMSDINGHPQKYQLVPVDYLDNIKRCLENLCDVLQGKSSVGNSSLEPIIMEDFPIMEDSRDSIPAFPEEEYDEEEYDGEYPEDAFSDMDGISEEDLDALIGDG